MAASARNVTDRSRTRWLRAVPDPAPREVVAVVLGDGSVVPVGREPGGTGGREWDQGQLAGDGWLLWWQRRSFEE